ncbi:hypothetical protein NUW58_g6153 [Xylaria curta]|uniref:Uncharacterized protein n=1 Tax=Xylaria curta TaxID=42375 RepID=A0ACC1NZL7_9PEZI|nr:hypothetical protein NUW58_g6153 [Xylaria curta]
MPWQEISPGHWQRPIGENERMIKWIGDRGHLQGQEHWSITATGTLTFSHPLEQHDLVSRLRRAWAIFRFGHPSIAATSGVDTLDYVVPTPVTLEQWTEETFHVILDPDSKVSDLIANIRPTPYVVGYYFIESNQMVLHMAHWRTDGVGALQLLNAFFAAIAADTDHASVQWGTEPARLTPSIEDVLELPLEPTPEIKAATTDCLASFGKIPGSVGLPYQGDIATSPRGTRGVRYSFSELASASILAACKAQGLRLLSAIHASLAIINLKLGVNQSIGDRGHYTSTMRFNLRPYLKSPFNSPQYASALYTGGFFSLVNPDVSWKEAAAQYEALYANGLSRYFLSARREYAIKALGMMTQNAGSTLIRSEIDISSIDDTENIVAQVHYGRAEPKGSRLELAVEDINIGVECLTRENYLFCWVFRGEIKFHLVYNEAFYSSIFMERTLEALVQNLQRALGIEN